MNQGFVLTRYFYDYLHDYEKGEFGFKNAVGLMIAKIDPRKEEKQASQIQFASAADPELLQLARPKQGKLLINAEERLAAGDPEGQKSWRIRRCQKKAKTPDGPFSSWQRLRYGIGKSSQLSRSLNKLLIPPKTLRSWHGRTFILEGCSISRTSRKTAPIEPLRLSITRLPLLQATPFLRRKLLPKRAWQRPMCPEVQGTKILKRMTTKTRVTNKVKS